MRIIKTPTYLSLVLSLALTACGGGGSGGSTTPGGTGSITGSVAGTTIIAVNSQGDILATDDTAGRFPDIDTDNDGFTDAFTFTLNNIPLSEDIQVYLITGGGIYPMYLDSDNNGSSDANVFALDENSGGQVTLGFIDVDDISGRAVLADNSVNDISINGTNTEIPASVNEPETSGLTIAELNERGANALDSGWVLGARSYYQAAADLAGNSTGNEADTARIMLAMTRVAGIFYDTLSDGNPNDLNRIGDLLDLFGIPDNDKRANWDLIEAPDTLPNNSPKGNAIRDFQYNVTRAEFLNAAASLDTVSTGFIETIEDDGLRLEIDYADIVCLSSFFKLQAARIGITTAYNWDLDIDDIANNRPTIESIYSDPANYPGQPDLTRLASAKSALIDALNGMQSSISLMSNETDNQSDDLFTIDDITDVTGTNNYISELLDSINGSSTQVGTVAINLQSFFDNGLTLDASTLPGFSANEINSNDGFFDDPTMGGVILDTDTTIAGDQTINDDSDFDGIADILQ